MRLVSSQPPNVRIEVTETYRIDLINLLPPNKLLELDLMSEGPASVKGCLKAQLWRTSGSTSALQWDLLAVPLEPRGP